jgi:hypothetical protein
MTDYRLRNYDLLYPDEAAPSLNWRIAALFGLIVVTAAGGVVSYLTDRFNAAAAGFIPAAASAIAQQPGQQPSDIQLATPRAVSSGS